MQVVYNAENIIDANLVKDLLEQAGIKAFVNGEYLAGGVGELPAQGLVSVSVADDDVAEAGPVIHQFQKNRQQIPGETRWDMNQGLDDWKG